MNSKEVIVNRLKSLKEIDNVNVKVGKQKSTVTVTYWTEKSLDFKFMWQDDHFIGYFMDDNGKQSQAVISIWKPIEAIHFVAAYSILIVLRAKRLCPL
ncbi:MAG: hypothetical protein ACLQUW_05785 [Desulfobaccales bacterium]